MAQEQTREALLLGSVPRCDHKWENGLCVRCFCPQTDADVDRAIAAQRGY